MIITDTVPGIRKLVGDRKKLGERIGFVPTMGCLHDGHLSLVRKARELCGFVVVSVFVNPRQFGPGEDYEKYPRTFSRDSSVCEGAGVDAIFHPSPSEMYGSGSSTFVEVSGPITTVLCGASRPGHFRGVTTVVAKLLNAVAPDVAVFGQKDAQQAFVVEKMARELDFPVEIIVSPTVREHDGLAMSSRNGYLSEEERKAAPLLYQALKSAGNAFAGGEKRATELKRIVSDTIAGSPLFKIDYVELVRTSDFSVPDQVDGEALLAVAAFLGSTRLIDNAILGVRT